MSGMDEAQYSWTTINDLLGDQVFFVVLYTKYSMTLMALEGVFSLTKFARVLLQILRLLATV